MTITRKVPVAVAPALAAWLVLAAVECSVPTALGFGADGEAATKVLSLKTDRCVIAGDMAWSPDGKVLAIPVKQLIDAAGKVIEPTPENRTFLKNVRWKIGLQLWDAATGRVQKKLGYLDPPIDGSVILFPLDLSVLVAQCSLPLQKTRFELWNLADRSLRHALTTPSEEALQFSPDGKVIAQWHQLGRTPGAGFSIKSVARLVDARTGKVMKDLKHEFTPRRIETFPFPMALAFSGDGKMLLTAERQQAILWSIPQGKKIRTLLNWKTGGEMTGTLAFSGGTLYRAGSTGIMGWDTNTGKLKLHWKGFKTFFAPRGNPIPIFYELTWNPAYPVVAVRWAGEINLWHLTTRKRLHTFSANTMLCGPAFAPDGRTLAISEGAQTVTLWQLEPLMAKKQP